MRRLILFFLVMASALSHESAQYLQNAVRDLRKLNLRPTLVRADTAMVTAMPSPKLDVPAESSVERRIQRGTEVPPLSLTKGELAALYESAIAKGETLKLDAGDDTYIHAAIHDLDHSENSPSEDYKPSQAGGDSTSGDASGYYYYYYPIKSFIDEMSSQGSSTFGEYTSYRPKKPKDVHTTQRPYYQFHSHHHQHNITINKEMMAEADKKPKTLEPLFMAISGFIGMAVMFVLSTLILPKFGSKPSKKNPWGKKNDNMEDFARLALNAIDENDCTERFRCELSKTARTFNLQDNRFIKLLKRIAPATFGRYMENVRKYESKLLKCTAIPCKKKTNINNTKNNNNIDKNITNKKNNVNNKKTNNKSVVKKNNSAQKKH